jgi:hypothetical protein
MFGDVLGCQYGVNLSLPKIGRMNKYEERKKKKREKKREFFPSPTSFCQLLHW